MYDIFAMMQVHTPPVIVNRHHLETPPPGPPPSTDKVICERPPLRFSTTENYN